jgi:hypothetical protein
VPFAPFFALLFLVQKPYIDSHCGAKKRQERNRSIPSTALSIPIDLKKGNLGTVAAATAATQQTSLVSSYLLNARKK